MTTKRASYHHGDLHQALLDAGDEVLRDLGFKGFTLRECARRAGVSHAAPKHHFGGVQGFLTEIAAGGFDKLTDLLQQELAKASNLEQEFLAVTRAYLSFAQQNPEHFRIMFRGDLVDKESEILRTATSKTFAEMTNVIHRQRGEPELTSVEIFAKPPSAQLNDIVIGWSHVHGLAHLVIERQLEVFTDTDVDALMKTAADRLSRMIREDASHI